MWKFDNIFNVVSTSSHDPLQRSIAPNVKRLFPIKDQIGDDTKRFKNSLNENCNVKYDRKNVTLEVLRKIYFYSLRT